MVHEHCPICMEMDPFFTDLTPEDVLILQKNLKSELELFLLKTLEFATSDNQRKYCIHDYTKKWTTFKLGEELKIRSFISNEDGTEEEETTDIEFPTNKNDI